MTKDELIYDWRKKEASVRDKLVAFVVVTMIFTFFWGMVRLPYASPQNGRSQSSSVIRFKDDEMGRFWNLQAEEEGPFPGRLELPDQDGGLMVAGMDGMIEWNVYESRLRPMSNAEGYSREHLTPKGMRVFPSHPKPNAGANLVPNVARGIRQTPVLIPYDSSATGWMPDALPDFVMPIQAGANPVTWRFAINLGEDGNVREAISLSGGDDAGQNAMEDWLRNVRFKAGVGDRWLGLRVEFVNQSDNGAEPE